MSQEWMAQMIEAYRELVVGDRIRLVADPPEWQHPSHYVPLCTRKLWRRLVARRRSLRVCEVDQWGTPWVRCRMRGRDGRWEHHSLAIVEGGWVRVKRRRTSCES